MTTQKSIDIAIADCRKAWTDFFAQHYLSPDAIHFEDGSPIQAWCLHHEVESERLIEPIENRISYILSDKPRPEQVCRFLNLRPMSLASIKVTGPAWAEYQKVTGQALAEYEKVKGQALAEYQKVTGQAWAEYEKVKSQAWAEYEKVKSQAWAEYEKVKGPALAEYEKVRGQAHLADVPHSTWNGRSIFAEKGGA